MDGSFSSSPVAGDAHRGVPNRTRTTRSPTARAALTASSSPPHVRVPWRDSISDQSAVILTTEAPTSRSMGKAAPSPAEKPMGTGRIAGAATSAGCAVTTTMSTSTTTEERLTHITCATMTSFSSLPLSTHRPAHVVRRVREERLALDGIAFDVHARPRAGGTTQEPDAGECRYQARRGTRLREPEVFPGCGIGPGPSLWSAGAVRA